jgi:hypothetical protein
MNMYMNLICSMELYSLNFLCRHGGREREREGGGGGV